MTTGRTLQAVIEHGPALLKDLEGKTPTAGRLKLYRAMKDKEADSIMQWFNPTLPVQQGWRYTKAEVEAKIKDRSLSANDPAIRGGSVIRVKKHLGGLPRRRATARVMTRS